LFVAGGVFVVLLCGLAFAVLVAIFEFCWNSRRNADFATVSFTINTLPLVYFRIFKAYFSLCPNPLLSFENYLIFSAICGSATPIAVR
jgi:hypothetical protein